MILSKNRNQIYDYIVLGAGPGGLQTGYYLSSKKRKYLILEGTDSAGAFFKKFPRHDRLLSINKYFTGYHDKEKNLRWDWNSLLSDNTDLLLSQYTRDYFPDKSTLLMYLQTFARKHTLNINFNTQITNIKKNGVFVLHDKNGRTFQSKRLIVSTGNSKPYLPDIPGIELTQNYATVSLNLSSFRDQSVLIIGKGNSGFETATHLISTASVIHIISPTPLMLAWKSHFPGHLRAVNNQLLDTYQLKSQNAPIDAQVERIEKNGNHFKVHIKYVNTAGGRAYRIINNYDRVITCTGFKFDDTIFDKSCLPQVTQDGRLPQMKLTWESTNIPDLFFAGTLMRTLDPKKSSTSFIHGFRYNIRTLTRLLEEKYYFVPYPAETVLLKADTLTDFLLRRLNSTSALWQLFGMICDNLIIDAKNSGTYLQELLIAFALEKWSNPKMWRYQISLEFGHIEGDPYCSDHEPFNKFSGETLIHPVIRLFYGKKVIAEHHVKENLYAEWKDENLHVKPLHQFLSKTLKLVSN